MKTRTWMLAMWAGLAVLGWIALFGALDVEDETPSTDASPASVRGFWVHGDRTLLLAGDGTFQTRLGCHGTNGTWELGVGTVTLAVANEVHGSCPQGPGELTPENPPVRNGALAGYLRFNDLAVPTPEDLDGSWASSAGEVVEFDGDGQLTGICPGYFWELDDDVLVTRLAAETPCPPPPARSVTLALGGPAAARLAGDVLFLRGHEATARLSRT